MFYYRIAFNLSLNCSKTWVLLFEAFEIDSPLR